MRKLLVLVAALAASPAFAQSSFLNGGFEDGNLGSWTIGGGYRGDDFNSSLTASRFLPGGSLFASSGTGAASNQVTIVTPGADPYVSALNRVFAGGYSVRVGDIFTGGYAGAITQSVSNYGATTMNFSWAAVLEPAHSSNDAPLFRVSVTNTTTGTVVYNTDFAAFGGAPTQGLFQTDSSGYVYAPWQSVSINTVVGNSYKIELLAADCEPTGHLGYAYLDGFGSVTGGGGDNGQVGGGGSTVPLPGTLALLGLGVAALGLRRKA